MRILRQRADIAIPIQRADDIRSHLLHAGSFFFRVAIESCAPLVGSNAYDLLNVSAPTIQRFLPLNEKIVPLINGGNS